MSAASQQPPLLVWSNAISTGSSSNNPFDSTASSSPPLQPSARTYFSLTASHNTLFVFGGFNDSKQRLNDLYSYSPATGWRALSTRGDGPKPVYLHSCVFHDKCLFVFGGNSGKDASELFVLNLENLVWQALRPTAGAPWPPARYGHAACRLPGGMLLVGGCKSVQLAPGESAPKTEYLNDAWLFDFALREWRKLSSLPLELGLAYHSLFTYEDTCYLFAGFNGVAFNEHLYRLDASMASWLPVRVSGAAPQPMCGTSLAAFGRHAYLACGYAKAGHHNETWRLDLVNRVWEPLSGSGPKPESRAYLQSCVLTSPRPALFIFGGYAGSACVQDFKSMLLPLAPAIHSSASPVHGASSMPSLPRPPAKPLPVALPVASPAAAAAALFAGIVPHQPQQQQQPQPAHPSDNNHNHFNSPASSSPNSSSHSSVSPPLPPSTASSNAPIPFSSFSTANGIARALAETSRNAGVEALLKHFAHGKEFLNRTDLADLLNHLHMHAKSQSSPVPPPKPQLTHSHSAASKFPFTASSFSATGYGALEQHPRLQDVIDIGFSRAHVLAVMSRLQNEGADLRNFQLIVNRCLQDADDSQAPPTSSSSSASFATSTPQTNGFAHNHTKPTAELESVVSLECVVCLDDRKCFAAVPCGHLCMCADCSQSLFKNKGKNKAKCPLCNETMESLLRVYF